MEEAGATSEPQQSQQEPTDDARSPDPAGRSLLVIGILLLVALVGLVAWVARGDDAVQTLERADERFPSADTVETTKLLGAPTSTTAVPTTAATVPPTPPPTTPAPTPPPTVPPTVAPGSTLATTAITPPGPSIDELVPDVAAFTEPLATPEAVSTQIAQLLASPRHDIASDDGVSALCAIVPLNGPIAVEGRWERDGHRVAATDLTPRGAPGFGECVGNEGDLLEDGSYQYIATDAAGVESAAAGFVVGAARIDQQLANNGDVPICGIRIAPSTSRYFEAYVFDEAPIAPGVAVPLPIADVKQDVEVTACRTDEVLAGFDFEPDPARVQDLMP